MDNRAEEVLAVAQGLGFDDAIVDAYTIDNLQVRFSNDEVDIVNRWRDEGHRVFLAKDHRIVTTEVKEVRRAKPTLEALVKVLRGTKENPDYTGIYGGPFHYRSPSVDPRVVEMKDPARAVQEAIAAARAEGATGSAGALFRTHEVHDLASSAGARGHDERAAIELSIRAFADREASGHGVVAASRLRDFHPERAGREAGEIARLARKPVLGKEGKYDTILAPMIFGALVDTYASMASAPTVMAGMSMFQDRIGKAVAAGDFDLINDETDEASMGRRAFDDEGVPTMKVAIVEDGVLKTYLHNASTAKKFKAHPTGNAWMASGYGASFLQPSPGSLVVPPGDQGREELLSGVKDGLYLTNTWYTRFNNRITGDFSTIPRDGIFRVKDGELVESWKDIRVTENLLDLFGRIQGLSKEAPQVRWWGEVWVPTQVPWANVAKVNITRSKDN